MNKLNIVSKATKIIGKIKFETIKYSPEILVSVGVVGLVASTVMACKATLKVDEVIEKADEKKRKIVTVKEEVDNGLLKYSQEYSDKDYKRDLTIVYAQTGLDFVKLYAPSVLIGIVSITCMLTSNNILRRRNLALAAAYETISKGYKQYRSRLIEKFGEDVDKELKYGLKTKQIEETVIDEKGKTKKVKKEIQVIDGNGYSEYARFFDDGCIGWDKNSEYNLLFLKNQQCHANDLLKLNGHLFLNEVYDMLGIPRSQAGQIVGWIYDEKNHDTDNFVDFGIYNVNKPASRDFVNGYEQTILLDFNVDGNVWKNMK